MTEDNRFQYHKCVIIGAGPAGYTAAIYAARAGLKPLVITGMQPGGQLTTTTEVENFPGYPNGVQGPAMMEDLRQQAENFGTQFMYKTVVDAMLSSKVLHLEDGSVIQYGALIIATGSTPKMLGIPAEEKFYGKGVSTCAVCDGFFYRGQNVVIVGAGDTACEEALYLANICEKVTMVVRSDKFKASFAMQQRVKATKNIHILYNSEVTNAEVDKDKPDDDGLGVVHVWHKPSKMGRAIQATGLFIAIGHTPNSHMFQKQLWLDSHGYIYTPNRMTAETNVPGVFVAGDVADPMYRQAITSAGSGCKAALDAERWLALH